MITNSITPKFPPSDDPLNNDRLSLTPHHFKENEEAIKKEKGTIIFNPSIHTMNDLEACFRIFSDSEMKCYIPATRPVPQERPPPDQTMIYFDSSIVIDTKDEVSIGSGLWYGENNE